MSGKPCISFMKSYLSNFEKIVYRSKAKRLSSDLEWCQIHWLESKHSEWCKWLCYITLYDIWTRLEFQKRIRKVSRYKRNSTYDYNEEPSADCSTKVSYHLTLPAVSPDYWSNKNFDLPASPPVLDVGPPWKLPSKIVARNS